jgi:hypothetical protein
VGSLQHFGEGTHAVIVCTDHYQDVPESNNQNCLEEMLFEVGGEPMPDLVVTGLSLNPAAPAVGQNITFTVTIANMGNAAAGPSTARFSADPNNDGSWHVNADLSTPGIPAGGSVNLTYEYSAQPVGSLQHFGEGTHAVIVCTDHYQDVPESNNQNCLEEMLFEVGGCSDGNPCTMNDVLTSGVCRGTPYSCDDGNACTADQCRGDGTCSYTRITAPRC